MPPSPLTLATLQHSGKKKLNLFCMPNANGVAGLLSIPAQKSVPKVLKTCYFPYSAYQWESKAVASPPRSLWLRYSTPEKKIKLILHAKCQWGGRATSNSSAEISPKSAKNLLFCVFCMPMGVKGCCLSSPLTLATLLVRNVI